MTIELFSIGHSRHEITHFIGLLQEHEIDFIADVRSAPFSRWVPHFNREPLKAYLGEVGIEIEDFGEWLGGKGETSVASLQFQVKLGEIIGIATRRRVALMCSEGNPAECHRAGKLFAWLHRYDGGDMPAVKTSHILRGGGLVDAREFEPAIIAKERWHELDWSNVGKASKKAGL